ncbi:scopoletin glucosyltransferase-like [Diospyros lotus]|uniref:scopoletin glucosyltransferase-like n=1 Tax=Diospyros lotus TaxID=55363 RepID=UPI00224CC127|nr:scopoletin glucosyltransferase-like [Diospyros lotus]
MATSTSSGDGSEIFVLPSIGSGHLFPSIELCHLISSPNCTTTTLLLLPSNLLPSLPPSFRHRTAALSSLPASPHHHQDPARDQFASDLETHISTRRPLCAVVDFKVGWTKHIFWKFRVPVVSFFTFGASAAAMEWGAWKSDAHSMNPGEARPIAGLPPEMRLNYLDVQSRRGGPKPGYQPPWVPMIEGSVGLMFNTCDDLERPFLDYLSDQIGLPVWAVGPLLPELCWTSRPGSLILERQIRPPKRESNYTDDELIQWLDSKPRGSVLYVSFGTETCPTPDEYPELAGALEDSTHPFIWVIQHGPGGEESYFPHGLASKVGDRGLIIRGWAPQLLILSHPAAGGFLSHGGWNSTAEAAVLGVPVLAWPVRGDQIFNAKLVVKHLQIGAMALREGSVEVARKDIAEGIERLMCDREVHRRAKAVRARFGSGFPASSAAALDAFREFIHQNA